MKRLAFTASVDCIQTFEKVKSITCMHTYRQPSVTQVTPAILCHQSYQTTWVENGRLDNNGSKNDAVIQVRTCDHHHDTKSA